MVTFCDSISSAMKWINLINDVFSNNDLTLYELDTDH